MSKSVLDQASRVVDSGGLHKQWRFLLSYRWWFGKPTLYFVLLNPADTEDYNNSPTVRRCAKIADTHGYGKMVVLNLFCFKADTPRDFLDKGSQFNEEKYVGPDANEYLQLTKDHDVVFAWGSSAPKWRVDEVLNVIREAGSKKWFCLGKTKNGVPYHPIANNAKQNLEKY